MAESYINAPEHVTQERVIKFFKEQLHYDYLGNLCDVVNKNIREDDLFGRCNFLSVKSIIHEKGTV